MAFAGAGISTDRPSERIHWEFSFISETICAVWWTSTKWYWENWFRFSNKLLEMEISICCVCMEIFLFVIVFVPLNIPSDFFLWKFNLKCTMDVDCNWLCVCVWCKWHRCGQPKKDILWNRIHLYLSCRHFVNRVTSIITIEKTMLAIQWTRAGRISRLFLLLWSDGSRPIDLLSLPFYSSFP